MNLGGKTAVVFGATGVIGAAVSRRLATEGARVLHLDETAAGVAWLASDAASGVAGRVINVCAGALVS